MSRGVTQPFGQDGSGIDEKALVFATGVAPLVGVLSHPDVPAEFGVVVVVGGPQYRAGSHRQFVHLAWALAAAGIAVLRFDYRGMGDSGGALRGFECIDDDIRAAIDALLRQQPQIARVALWGLCDGASAALMYAPTDNRVAALALANPWVRGAATAARARLLHYYARRLLAADLWRRLFAGQVRVRQSVGEIGGSVRDAWAGTAATTSDFQQRMIDALQRFDGPILWLMSGNDLTSREFDLFMRSDRRRARLLAAARCTRVDFADADHTFSGAAAEAAVADATVRWLHERVAAAATHWRDLVAVG